MLTHRSCFRKHFVSFARNGGLFVDATLGLGGHTKAILESSPDTRVIGLDQDGEAIELASQRLAGFGSGSA